MECASGTMDAKGRSKLTENRVVVRFVQTPILCHSEARFLCEESAFLASATKLSVNSRFLLFATLIVGMNKGKEFVQTAPLPRTGN